LHISIQLTRLTEIFQTRSKTIPAGNWVVVATANIVNSNFEDDDPAQFTSCELRNGANVIGGASDIRPVVGTSLLTNIAVSLTMNGGAALPQGGTISLWCRQPNAPGVSTATAQMMIVQVGGFF
jgi:hypothetical protein